MAGSLFDQLKKAGLVDEKKAKKVKQEKYQQTKQNKSGISRMTPPNLAIRLRSLPPILHKLCLTSL